MPAQAADLLFVFRDLRLQIQQLLLVGEFLFALIHQRLLTVPASMDFRYAEMARAERDRNQLLGIIALGAAAAIRAVANRIS